MQYLLDGVLDYLGAYQHTRKVYFVDEVPQTHLGKVDRGALKKVAGSAATSLSTSALGEGETR